MYRNRVPRAKPKLTRLEATAATGKMTFGTYTLRIMGPDDWIEVRPTVLAELKRFQIVKPVMTYRIKAPEPVPVPKNLENTSARIKVVMRGFNIVHAIPSTERRWRTLKSRVTRFLRSERYPHSSRNGEVILR
jgi:hypothetical protein